MEFAQGYFPRDFDFVVSGINIGENIGYSTVTASGTGGAGLRALALGLTEKVILMSWMQKTQEYGTYLTDTSQLEVTEYLEYPGKSAVLILEEILQCKFWNKKIINVNFPMNLTKKYKITNFVENITKFYKCPVIISENFYTYEEQALSCNQETKNDLSIDVGALLSGYISVTPFDIK